MWVTEGVSVSVKVADLAQTEQILVLVSYIPLQKTMKILDLMQNRNETTTMVLGPPLLRRI